MAESDDQTKDPTTNQTKDQTKDQTKEKGRQPNQHTTHRRGPAPFEVEFGTDRNQMVMINTLKMRVRGRYSLATFLSRPGGARDVGAMARMPTIPGMRLAVHPARLTCRLHDPLEGDDELLGRINATVEGIPSLGQGGTLTHVPASEHQLTQDAMKTLLLELNRRTHEFTITNGDLPTPREIEDMEGDELYDPHNSSARRPKYKKDVEAYEARIDRG